jgi:hypothetical protein
MMNWIGLVLLGLASCSILGIGGFLTFCVIFARKDDKVLQRKSCSCDEEWQEGETLFDEEPIHFKVLPAKEPDIVVGAVRRYDWSHIKTDRTVKIEDCFE